MKKEDQKLESYQYELPEQLIAQTSAEPRDSARLFVTKRNEGVHHHVQVRDIVDFLTPDDILVLNDTKVFKARTYAISSSGRMHEVLLIPKEDQKWQAICSQTKKLKEGMYLFFQTHQPKEVKGLEEKEALKAMAQNKELAKLADLKAIIKHVNRETGEVDLVFSESDDKIFAFTDSYGDVPLPPYIENQDTDLNTYQTAFARNVGSVAAPTAGRHFTPELLKRIEQKGVRIEYITLHVGIGTFLPVWVEDIREHSMHAEWLSISKKAIQHILKVKRAEEGRVIAVGTTVTRALEGAYKESNGNLEEGFEGYTDIFIAPGFEFKIIDGLLTNFHLPGTSLLMLVSALLGREKMLDIYKEAVRKKYRFYSLGDAMLIL